MTNIDKLREITKELDNKEEVIKVLWLYSPSLICVFNETHFIDINPTWTVELEWTRDELLKMSFFDLLHPDDHESTRKIISDLMYEPDIIALNFVNHYRCKNSEYKTLSWYARVITDNGVCYGFARTMD